MGDLMIDAAPLGEMALLFGMTRPVKVDKVVYSSWDLPPGIILLFFIYLLPGLCLIYSEYRCWNRWLKELDKAEQEKEEQPEVK
jgi:hypothetical protein